MDRSHDSIEFRATHTRLTLWPAALLWTALLPNLCWMDPVAFGLLAGVAITAQLVLSRERVSVRIDPQWLLVWRRFPWFTPPRLERFALVGIATARAQRGADGWWVQVRMRPPFHTHVVDLPVVDAVRAKMLAEMLTSEADAARSRADPALARSRIVVPPELTDLVDRDRR